ncbi:hypothetical protein HQ531_12420 [bacterium]|nr:hypothetical protein [bacterium]
MLENLRTYPSKLATRVFIFLGLLIFIPVYSYMMRLFTEMGIDTNEFNEVWLSFDLLRFKTFVANLDQQGHLPTFISSFKFNILSIFGFMLAFTGVALVIARHLHANSRLLKAAYVFPLFPVAIAVDDIGSSLVLILVSGDLANVTSWVIYTMSIAYALRIILLYALVIWFVAAGISIVVSSLRRKNQTEAA